MIRYRATGPLIPGFVLLGVPLIAAHPWRLPFGETLALPLLGLLIAYVCGLRYPGLLLAPLAFVSGIVCDLVTRAPLGYWALLYMLAAVCAGITTRHAERFGAWFGWSCLVLLAPLAALAVWGLSSLYLGAAQPFALIADGMLMALLLLPLPLVLLIGLEPLLTIRSDRP